METNDALSFEENKNQLSMSGLVMPFTQDDLQHPADEGCTLHDEVSHFLQLKLGIMTSVASSNMPKSQVVTEEAFKAD